MVLQYIETGFRRHMCLATSPLHEIEEHVLQLRGTVALGADEPAKGQGLLMRNIDAISRWLANRYGSRRCLVLF